LLSLPVFLFLLYLCPPAFLHSIFLLLTFLPILDLTLSAITFLLVSVSLENLCCYAPSVGFNMSIHLLRFKSVRPYQRERKYIEQTDAGNWLCVTDLYIYVYIYMYVCPKYVLHFRGSSAGVATKLRVTRPRNRGLVSEKGINSVLLLRVLKDLGSTQLPSSI
jgi:hypothetical protein